MTPETWTAVDDYLGGLLVGADAALDKALQASDAAQLPAIAVSAPQGKFLHLLARIRGAKRILEIGTLGGYSTIWLARALPDGGRLISLEFEPRHAEVARQNVARAGLADRVEIRIGPAIDALPALPAGEPFDLVFIDADKPSTPDYVRWALKLTRPGSVIVVDNVIRKGEVIADRPDANAAAMREAMGLMAREPRLTTTVIQTVGSKGYDGFAIALVN